MALDREQRQILNVILAEGQKIRNPRVRRKYERAAVQTAIVESGIRNLPGGHADSAGWRQERASLYPNPTNVRASARRFRREFQQHFDPGERSFDVAAQVQRPREDLRGRYREEAGKAAAILRQLGRGGRQTPGGTQPGSTLEAASSAPEVGGTPLADLLGQATQRQAVRPTASAPPAPAHSAQLAFAGQPVQNQPRQEPAASGLQAQLDAISEMRGTALPASARDPEMPDSGRAAGAGGRGGGGKLKPRGGYMGTQGVARDLAAIGFDLGLKTMSTKRHNANPYSGDRSDHDHGNKDAYAYDISNGSAPTPEMDRAAYRIMHRLGFKDYKMGEPINTSRGVRTINGMRIQVIYRGSGAAFGGNHLHHIHVGVKRVRR